MLEKSKVGAQLDDAERRKAVHDHILLHEAMFRRQGVVAATYLENSVVATEISR
jgi:hypothetical protein